MKPIPFLICILLGFYVQGQTKRQAVDISAQCDVYYYNLMQRAEDTRNGAGIPPIEIDVHGMRSLRLDSVMGTVNFAPWNDSLKTSDADGLGPYTTAVGSSKGLSGIKHTKKCMFVVGVFINKYIVPDNDPVDVDFSDKENYTFWGPDLNQVFFIGDGKDNKNRQQVILIPTDAEKLYLGFADALSGPPGSYGDNIGSIKAVIVLDNTLPNRN